MNKKQLISIIRTEVLLAKSSPERKGYIAGLEEAINIIEGFSDESQKPVVPQFVADWYEENKDDFETNLFTIVYEVFEKRDDNELTEIEKWLIDEHTKPFSTLVNMHQFGYEVEKEKWYTVKMRATKQPLFYNNMYEKIFFSLGELATRFTRKELEGAGFGEVFNSPLFEVEEVE